MLEVLRHTDGLEFAVAEPRGGTLPVRSKLFRALRAAIGDRKYLGEGFPEVGRYGEQDPYASTAAKRQLTPDGYSIAKAANLNCSEARADFGRVHQLAAEMCRAAGYPGAIVVANDHKPTPHYLISHSVGRHYVREVAKQETEDTLEARREYDKRQAVIGAAVAQISQNMHLLLESGATTARDTLERLVDVRKLSPHTGKATLELRDELALWSASESKATGAVEEAYGQWRDAVGTAGRDSARRLRSECAALTLTHQLG